MLTRYFIDNPILKCCRLALKIACRYLSRYGHDLPLHLLISTTYHNAVQEQISIQLATFVAFESTLIKYLHHYSLCNFLTNEIKHA